MFDSSMKYFQHLCGTDPHPTQFRAKKYKLDQRFMEKKDFMEMMQVTSTKVGIYLKYLNK